MMLWPARLTIAACALAMSQPIAACNQEAFELPWDLAQADTVVVAKISNFRIVSNDAEGQRMKKAVEAGTADSWQKKQYQESVSKGLPPGGTFGLFDVSVEEVLKGKAARHFTVIFPDTRLCCFGGRDPSILPTSIPIGKALIGLQRNRSGRYNDLKLPLLYTDSCVGPMMFSLTAANHTVLTEARRYFGSKRKH